MKYFIKPSGLSTLLPLLMFMLLSQSTTQAAESYNIYRVMKEAEAHSPALKSYDLNQESIFNQSKQSQTWNNPILTLDVGKEKDPMGRNQYLNVILAQPLYLPGTYTLREQLAQHQVKLSDIERVKNRIDWNALILRQYFAAQIADQQLEHAEDRHARYETVSTYLRSRPFASPQQKIEVFNVNARILQRKTELSDSQAAHRSAYSRLSMLTQSSVSKVAPQWLLTLPSLDFNEIERHIENSVSVKTTQTQIDLERTQLRLLDKEKYGPLSVTLTAQQFNGPSQQEIYAIGLIAPLPVFNRLEYSLKANEGRIRSLESKVEFEKRQAIQEIQELKWKYEALQNKLAILKVSEVHQLERNIKLADVEFKKGRVDLITYLDFDDQHEAIFNEIMSVQSQALEFLIQFAHLTHNEKLLKDLLP